MVYEEKNITKMQNIVLENRNNLLVSGVLDVLNFDEQMVTLDTELSVEGEIASLVYNDKSHPNKKGESVFTKIFK